MFTSHSISYSTVVTVCLESWKFGVFSTQNQPHISLAVLARHSQAQECLQINPKPFQQVVMNF